MNKTILAWCKGYIYFRVNDEFYLTYNKALVKRKTVIGDVTFNGLHFWRGWECFYLRIDSLPVCNDCA